MAAHPKLTLAIDFHNSVEQMRKQREAAARLAESVQPGKQAPEFSGNSPNAV